MKILFITSLYPVSADSSDITVTWSLHKLVRQWQKRDGVQVRVVRPVYIYLSELLRFRGKIGSNLKPLTKKNIIIDEVPVIIFPVYKIPQIAYYYKHLYKHVAKWLRCDGWQPDMVVAHYDKSLHIGYEYATLHNLPLAAGLHITPDLMQENSCEFSRRCQHILERASLIACRSRYIYNKIHHWFPQHKDKSIIAYSGIEAAHIAPLPDALQRLKQWKETAQETISIVSVSSLIQRKHIDTVLRALAGLDVHQPWKYTVIGEGDERLKLEALAGQLGIDSRVRFTGLLPRERVIAELKQAHVFVLISSLETFGLVYLEAMAAGLLTIGAKNEGIDGIIHHYKNGFLSPAGQSKPLTTILEHIITGMTLEELQPIITQAHHTIGQYTEEQAAHHYLHCLQKSLTGSGRPGRHGSPGGSIQPVSAAGETQCAE